MASERVPASCVSCSWRLFARSAGSPAGADRLRAGPTFFSIREGREILPKASLFAKEKRTELDAYIVYVGFDPVGMDQQPGKKKPERKGAKKARVSR